MTEPIAFDDLRGLWDPAADARACLVLAHGAGAGMTHAGMEGIAAGLARRGVAVLRFDFPYMTAGGRRPDPPAVAQRAVRAAVREGARRARELPLFAGGRSFGGRMTSQAEALEPLGVHGLVFFGFPLHPAGKPGVQRADHLRNVRVPMLFLQGERDALADLALLCPLLAALRSAELHIEPGADHGFHVPKRSGRSDADVLDSLLDAAARWMSGVVA